MTTQDKCNDAVRHDYHDIDFAWDRLLKAIEDKSIRFKRDSDQKLFLAVLDVMLNLADRAAEARDEGHPHLLDVCVGRAPCAALSARVERLRTARSLC
jgi:hypothetical protein